MGEGSEDWEDAIAERNSHLGTGPGELEVHEVAAEGWIGGFSTSNEDFEYPKCDLSELEDFPNRTHDKLLKRQMKVIWPEFSWQTAPGLEESRCFQMFSHDISRLGYTNEGRVYSIICPQLGAYLEDFGSLNIEITVTGQRGWVNESAENADDRLMAHKFAAELSVQGAIWFAESAKDKQKVKDLVAHAERKFKGKQYDFPFSKEHAIKVKTTRRGSKVEELFTLRTGISPDFDPPGFAVHERAYAVGHLDAQIGPLIPCGDKEIDEFNQLLVDLYNVAAGNMAKEGNILTWNVWMEAPTVVDEQEWAEHSEKWRESIEADHGAPTGNSSKKRFKDARVFVPEDEIPEEVELITKRVDAVIERGLEEAEEDVEVEEEGIEKEVKKVEKEVKKDVKKVEKEVKKAEKEVKGEAKKVEKEVKKEVKKVEKEVKKEVKEVDEDIEAGAAAVEKDVEKAASKCNCTIC